MTSTDLVREDGTAPGSLADRVFERIKREIVECRLLPETILAEGTIAARYGVSRAPAREALKQLAASGFVRAVHRVGYIVAGFSVQDFDEISVLRLALEPLATELAVPRLTSADLEVLRPLAQAPLDAAHLPLSEQGSVFARTNASFHRGIAKAAGNQRLERTIAGLIDELERLMHMLPYSELAPALLRQHSALLETMVSGDAAGARRMMEDQLVRDHEVMRELATRSGRPSFLALHRASTGA